VLEFIHHDNIERSFGRNVSRHLSVPLTNTSSTTSNFVFEVPNKSLDQENISGALLELGSNLDLPTPKQKNRHFGLAGALSEAQPPNSLPEHSTHSEYRRNSEFTIQNRRQLQWY
jgi:hypothetical protein